MNTIQRIAKNIGVLFGAQVIGYILAFLYTIYIARFLGADGFGILSFALSFTAIIGILADLGLSTLLVRELARDKSLTKKYIGNITLMKLILAVFTFGMMVLTINLLNYPQQIIQVVYFIGLSVILSSFAQMFYSVFQAYEKMEYQSVGNILNNLLIFAGIFLGIALGFNVIEFSIIYLISSLIVTIYSLIICLWKFVPPTIKLEPSFWKIIIVPAIPLSLVALSSTIYFRIDSVLLSFIQGEAAVGWYNAAYKLIELLLFVPSVYTVAIFPVLSNYYSSSKKNLEFIYTKSYKYLFIVGIPIATTITVLAPEIILLLYQSGYTESILTLQILIWAIPLMFLSYTNAWIFISINKQNLLLKLTFVMMVANIILNLILIPQYSYLGAALATVITTLLGFPLELYFLSKYICKIEIGKIMIKPVAASVISGLIIFKLNTGLFLSAAIAIISYLGILILIKTFSSEDFEIFRNMKI
jgi:O-antigen/teichoic acid export membrane protein